MFRKPWKEIPPKEVAARIRRGEKLTIIDVREPEEWALGHIPGARHIPLNQIPERIGELDPGKDTILVCRSGGRSERVCEYLSRLGHKVVNMPGGMSEWPGDMAYGK